MAKLSHRTVNSRSYKGLAEAEVTVLIWTRIPDIVCAVLMIWAFRSVPARQAEIRLGIWMLGWVIIIVHSVTSSLHPASWNLGRADIMLLLFYSAALASAGLLFSYALIPSRDKRSRLWLLFSLGTKGMVSLTILILSPGRHWAMNLAAALLTLCPLAVILTSIRTANERYRWIVLAFCASLSTSSSFSRTGVHLVSNLHGVDFSSRCLSELITLPGLSPRDRGRICDHYMRFSDGRWSLSWSHCKERFGRRFISKASFAASRVCGGHGHVAAAVGK